MKKIFLFILIFFVSYCFAHSIEIVSTTTQILSVVKEIGKENVNVSVLIPAGICPGHYEMKPADLKKLLDGGIFVYHGWEGFVEDILNTISSSSAKAFKIDVSGSWLVPHVQIEAAEKITKILENTDKKHKKIYETNLALYKKQMQNLDRKIKNFIANNRLIGIKVVSSKMQKDFLTYLGFDVIDCFGSDEEITPGDIIRLINSIKNHNVKIIVSNLQSGTSTGEMLAKKTSLAHVIISNFPGGFENTRTIEDTIMKNINLLKNAADKKINQ